MRAILYARVSQDVQRDNYSIPTQIATCLAHAKAQGYGVVGASTSTLRAGAIRCPALALCPPTLTTTAAPSYCGQAC